MGSCTRARVRVRVRVRVQRWVTAPWLGLGLGLGCSGGSLHHGYEWPKLDLTTGLVQGLDLELDLETELGPWLKFESSWFRVRVRVRKLMVWAWG